MISYEVKIQFFIFTSKHKKNYSANENTLRKRMKVSANMLSFYIKFKNYKNIIFLYINHIPGK